MLPTMKYTNQGVMLKSDLVSQQTILQSQESNYLNKQTSYFALLSCKIILTKL